MPWDPRPLHGEGGDWQPSLASSLGVENCRENGVFTGPVDGDWDSNSTTDGEDHEQGWAQLQLAKTIDPPPVNQEEDDPTQWPVLALMTALRGWVGRPSSGASGRPITGAWENDILGDIKAAWLEGRGITRYFVSDINLELRHRPDPAARNWLSVPPRTMVFWRGQVGYDDATGQPWYLVYRLHRGELYSGYVPAAYLRPPAAQAIPESIQPSTPAQPYHPEDPSIQDDLEMLWRKLLTDEERQTYYQPWFDMQSEIGRLVGLENCLKSSPSSPRLMQEVPPELMDEMNRLLHPAWLLRNGPPPAFMGQYGRYAISTEIQRMLRNTIFQVYRLQGPVSRETWGIIGQAFGIPAADAFLQVLHPDLWTVEFPATTESGLPLKMSILPHEGVYLRPRPELIQNLESAPFRGIIQGDQVTVVGDYHLVEGGDGQPQVMLLVDYEYANGQTYRGWVPAGFLGTRLVSLTPEMILWEGPINTLGYNQGVEPWQAMGYHTFGQAQFLNLRVVFQNLGWENWAEFPDRHRNLCGQLATMESMNVSLEEGFRVFASTSSGLGILQNSEIGTSASDLEEFIENLGWQAEVHFGTGNLEPFLSSNQVVLALVASTDGLVRSDGWSGHWVHVLGFDHDAGVVRFYNPLFNQQQDLAITEFHAAWDRTDEAGITNVDQIFVSAHP
jgi:hypothetical protein